MNNMNKFEALFNEMVKLVKEDILNDKEFLLQLKDKLEEDMNEVAEPKEQEEKCDGNCGDNCKYKNQKLEDLLGANEKFVLTNDKGEELIDTDDLNVFIDNGETTESEECENGKNDVEQYAQNVTDWFDQRKEQEETFNNFEEFSKRFVLDDEEDLEDNIEDNAEDNENCDEETEAENSNGKKFGIAQATVEDLEDNTEAENNTLKKFGIAQATVEDLEDNTELKEEEIELTPEQLMELMQQMQQTGEIDVDIDLGDLVEQIKLISQQKDNYKFMERDVQEYDDIIEKSFGLFPTDLSGNDEIF